MKRVYILGLDALQPKLTRRFAADGTCPNFKRIMDNGGFSKVLAAMPAQTPENWTTIATGSMPGTHGIAVWGRHSHGQPITEKHGQEAMSSNLCKAEYLWEAAERQGLSSVLLNFVGYPPTADRVVHVDWFWRPGRYYFEICSNACYIHDALEGGAERRPGGISIPVESEEAIGWTNIPESESPPLETVVEVLPKVGGRGVSYNALLLNPDGQGYTRCLLSREKDGVKALCTLGQGEWSGWFREVFTVNDEEKIGTVRFKLVELSRDGKRFNLYRSQVYPISSFTHPPEVAEELVEKFGPYINEAIARAFLDGLVDEQTFVEEFMYQINWIANAAKFLMDKYESSIYMMQWHFPDTLEHRVLGLVDPVGGMYDPDKAERAWKILRLGYRITDRLVGEFLKFVDDETYLIIVSDHGDSPNRKVYSIVKALADDGLIEIEEHKGKKSINWAKSKIFIDLTNVYINLRSRYTGGVVEDWEYEEVRKKTIHVLRSCKDQDGEYVVSFALRKEDAPMIGLWGEHVGDVVFVYQPGFTWGSRLLDGGSMRVGGANHGPQIPTTETEISSNYATFMVIGKGIKKGYVRPVDTIGPVKTVDIATTVSYMLEIKPPRHSQGTVLHDFFEGWDVSDMKRQRKPLKFPSTAPLIGDVTDTDPAR
jgi:predicted AlkP superfamily phosphohydrolase/phosphomutase